MPAQCMSRYHFISYSIIQLQNASLTRLCSDCFSNDIVLNVIIYPSMI